MKKFSVIILAFALLASLTACDRTDKPHWDSPIDSPANSADNFSDSTGTSDNNNEAPAGYPDRSVRYVYGEVEIPDFEAEDTCLNKYEQETGRGDLTDEEIKKTLGSMVFETLESGGYKYSLVGENVRTDKQYNPYLIFAERLYIEVEKDGAVLGQAEYGREFHNHDEYGFVIYEELLGNYISVYEMDHPIIAAFYVQDEWGIEFFAVTDEGPIELIGDFSAVGEGMLRVSDWFGIYIPVEENTMFNVRSGYRLVFDPERIAADQAPHYTVTDYYRRPSDTPEPPDYIIGNITDRSWLDENLAESDVLFPTEFTEDDLQLQAFLKETSEQANFLGTMFSSEPWAEGVGDHINDLRYFFPQLREPIDEQRGQFYYPIKDEYPRTCEELRGQLEKYFSSNAVESFMSNVAKGEFIENEDGTHSCIITEGRFDDEGYLVYPPKFIEFDGRFYCGEGIGINGIYGYWDSARIVSRSDTDILFTYIGDYIWFYYSTGHLVYEDGWKYDWRGNWQF